MSIQIKLKNSVVQDSTPSTSDLPAVGEIALNANINSIGGFMRASNNTIVKIFGPGSVTTPTATTTVSGIAELATSAETTTGSATNRVVTPAGLNAVTVAERTTSNNNYVAKAGGAMTGVLTIPAGTNTAPGLNFGDTNSGLFAGGANNVSLTAGGTTRLVADTTGIAVTGTLAVTGAITSTSDLTIAEKIIHSGDANTCIKFPAVDTVSVETNGSEALRIINNQKVLIGTSSSRGVGGSVHALLQVEGTNAKSQISIVRNEASNGGAFLTLAKSRSAIVGGNTVVQDNDGIGTIRFSGADGTDMLSDAAAISAFIDGTPGSNDMPGRLVFSTTTDGADSPTTRLTIDSAGLATFANAVSVAGNLTVDTNTFHVDSSNNRIGVGTTSPAGTISLNTNNPNIRFDDSDTSNNGEITLDNTTLRIECDEDNAVSSSAISFRLDGSEKASIDANGLNITQKLLHEGDNDTFLEFLTDTICFDTGGTEAARIDLSQRLLVGISSARGIASRFPSFQVEGGNNSRSSLSVMRNSADNAGSSLILGKSRGTSNLSNTIVNDDDQIGVIRFCAADGTDTNSQAAAIAVFIDGTPGSNDVPGRLLFMTANDGSSAATEKMTIKADGKVGIGVANPNELLHISGGNLKVAQPAGTDAKIVINEGTTTNGIELSQTATESILRTSASQPFNIRAQAGSGSTSYLAFWTKDNERLRIQANGNIGINTTSAGALLDIGGNTDNNIQAIMTRASDSLFQIQFRNESTSNNTGASQGKFGLFRNAEDIVGMQFHRGLGTGAGALSFTTGGVERVRIAADGDCGIGTDNPQSRLHISSGTTGDCELIIEADPDNNNENDNPRVVFRQDGGSNQSSVGIGNNTLQLRNGVSSGGGILFMTSSTVGQTNAVERMRVLTSGDVRIGATTADGRLGVKSGGNGSGAFCFVTRNSDNSGMFSVRNDGGVFTGNINASPYNFTTTAAANCNIQNNGRLRRSTSSIRYKKDITDAKWGLAEVLKLKPVTYKSNGTGENADDKTYGGFTAEDIHDLGLTEFVEYNESNQPDALHYGNMVALLANAIKELAAKVTKLEGA